jgi:hypothetical protein
MNNCQLNSSIKFQTRSSPIINKIEILNEFNNLHKLKQEIKNHNRDNFKGKNHENKFNNLINKIPYATKLVNNHGYKSLNKSEPRKVISTFFTKLKNGVTYTGSLYNNKMESKLFLNLFILLMVVIFNKIINSVICLKIFYYFLIHF